MGSRLTNKPMRCRTQRSRGRRRDARAQVPRRARFSSTAKIFLQEIPKEDFAAEIKDD
jgi:hypothetical protein